VIDADASTDQIPNAQVEKWREAITLLYEFGFGRDDLPRILFVLEHIATPKNWKDRLADVLSVLAE